MAFIRDIGSLGVKLVADASKFNKEMEKSRRSVETFSEKSKRNLAAVGKGAAILGTAFAAAGAAIGGAVKHALNFADAIGKAADVAGVSTDALQEWRYAGDKFGLSQQTIDDGLRRFTKRIGEFINTGAGPAKSAMEDMGISVTDAGGNIKSMDVILDEITEVLGGYETQAEKSAQAAKLFGHDAGPKMALMLSQGSKALTDLKQEAHDLGIVLDEDLIRSAELANDKLSAMGDIVNAAWVTFWAEWADEIAEVAAGILNFIKALRGGGRTLAEFDKEIKETTEELAKLDKEMADNSGLANFFNGASRKADVLQEKLERLNEEKAEFEKNNPITDETLPNEAAAKAKAAKAKAEAEAAAAKAKAEAKAKAKASCPKCPIKPFSSTSASAAVATVNADATDEKKVTAFKTKITESHAAVEEAMAASAEKTDMLRYAADELSVSFSDLFSAASEGGDAFTLTLDNILVKLKDMAIEMLVMQPLKAAMSSMLMGAGGMAMGMFGGGGYSGPTGDIMGAIMGSGGGTPGKKPGGMFGLAGGGRVYPGNVYEVGERGRELFTPDSAGSIRNKSDSNSMLGGSPKVSVNVINQGTNQTVARQQSTQTPDGMVVSVIMKDLKQGGPISKGMEGTYGVRR